MPIKSLFATLSVIVACASYMPYALSVLRGRTKPHVFSWLIWGMSSSIVFVAQLVSKGGLGSCAAGFSAFACAGIAVLAFFRGEKEFTRGDWVSLGLVLFAVPLWLATKNPLGAVVLVTFIDAIAYYPTYRKSIAKPYQELSWKYALTAVKYLLALLALDTMNLTTVLYPVMTSTMEAGLVLLLFFRRAAMDADTYCRTNDRIIR